MSLSPPRFLSVSLSLSLLSYPFSPLRLLLFVLFKFFLNPLLFIARVRDAGIKNIARVQDAGVKTQFDR